MPFEYIFYLELCWLSCLAERNHLVNYGRGHYEKRFCEIILNLNQWFRKRCQAFFGGAGPFGQFWQNVL